MGGLCLVRNTQLIALAVLALAAGWAAPAERGECPPADPAAPRTLVLALDGVPLRSVREAIDQGAFAGWPEPQALISTFPSVTNVAFSAILRPFGVAPAGGYEVQHFDRGKNEVVGGSPFGYQDRLYAWRDAFDVTSRTFGSKLKTYTRTRKACHDAVDEAEELLLESPKELILAHVGATDALVHLRGDKATLKFLLELDRRLIELKQVHAARTGRPLRLVLLSDHGNSAVKIHKAAGLHKALRRAGLDVVEHLEEPGDVVAPTFGIVGYGALFTYEENAETAGHAVVGNRTVDVAAWLAAPDEMIVLSSSGRAVVRWRRDLLGGWSISYDPTEGDPLGFRPLVDRLGADGRRSVDGFVHEDDWFAATVGTEYPDALRRLIHSLTGTYVENYATVVFSLEHGYAWGWTAAHLSSRLNGGRLEGTHGGLDAVSSVGFFMTDDPATQPSSAVRSEQALANFAASRDCLVVAGDDDPKHPHPGM